MKRRGLALELFGSVAAGLSFGEPMWPTVGPTLSWDDCGTKCLDLLATQRRLLAHGSQQKSCMAFMTGATFQHSLLLLISSFFESERCACSTASASFGSPPLPPLTQTPRSPCSKMGWVQSSKISPHFLIYFRPDGPLLFLTSCLVRAAPCMGISSTWVCRSHRSDLLIGTIKL